jgi:hypothetical protein
MMCVSRGPRYFDSDERIDSMAKSKRDEKLFKRLRSFGVRKGTARKVSESMVDSGDAAPEAARTALADLHGAVAEIENRLPKGREKRRAAAKKAARTRAKNAKKRSQAAKKAARARTKSKS